MNWSDFRLRLRALFFRRQMEGELDEELQFHLAMETRKDRERGLDGAQTKRRVNLKFGGLEQVKEECREARGVHYIENFVQDVRYASQGLRHTPGFAVTVIATIALGLGLNTALFTVLNAYVLQPLKVRDPNSLYQFTWAKPNGEEHRFSRQEFEDFRKQNPAFADAIATNQLPQARVEGHLMLCQLVSDNYFPMLAITALRGRTLLPEDEEVAVLSAAAWTKKFDSDPAIIGKRLVIHNHNVEIVGVAQPGFRGVGEIALDIWLPLSKAFGPEPLTLIGRLRNDITLGQAQSALITWVRRRTAGRPSPEQTAKVILRSRATILSPEPELVAAIAPIMVAFGLVLLVACANVANMMLARGMARQREIGIRLAMGAGRSRLIAQLLTESLVLAVPAAAGGFLISQQSLRAGEWLLYNTLPASAIDYLTLMPALQPDIRVFGFMLAGAFLCALLFGLLPAMQATRSNVLQAARGEFTTDFRPARLRDVLVIAQVTVSVVLLVCSAVLLSANSRLQNIDTGLEMNGVVELKVQEALRERTVRQLGADPGVQIVAAASKMPFMGSLPRVPVVATEGAGRYPAGYLYASPEYFHVFQVPILRGRNFTREEAASAAAVVVVSQATALRLWPGRDALGQSLRIQLDPQQARSLADPRGGPPKYSSVKIIGIARDAANGWVGDGQDQTCIYFPTTALNDGNVLFTRASGDAELSRRRLDSVLTASLPGAVTQITSMQEIRDAQLYPFRAAYWISMTVGGLALLLTLTGIYGVLSYVVSQRTKEIGIRVALGARPGSVAGLILRQSLRFAVIGALIGSFGALGMIRAIASQVDMRLFAFDKAAFAMGLLLVIAASAAAAWIPSRRAAHIEPVSTLRCD